MSRPAALTPTRGRSVPRSTAPVLLACRGLVAGYGDLIVLRGVDLEIRCGEVVALLGSNGAGKTTALRALSGTLTPLAGTLHFADLEVRFADREVRLAGRAAAGLTPVALAGLGLAHVPEGRGLFGEMTVEDNLRLGLVGRAVPRADRRARLEAAYELFPILHGRRRQLAGSLSGGEQQMLAIARGMVGNPRLLMLDEPSLGLAPAVAERVLGVLGGLQASGVTVLWVEQDVGRALAVADWGYVLEGGMVRLEGPGSALAGSQDIRRAYLGMT